MGSSPQTRNSGQDRQQQDVNFGSQDPSDLISHTELSSTESDTDFESDDTAIFESSSQRTRILESAPLITTHRRLTSADQGDDDHDGVLGPVEVEEKPVTWSSLPKKGQLAILTLARLSEPLTQTSLQAYMFYQLKSFDPSLPDSKISVQAGILQGSFTAAQFITAVWWGRLADAEWMGRKRVLLIGLMGTCLSCVGFGFSRSFATAMVFRTLGGILNSNVGVMRTLIAEIISEKKDNESIYTDDSVGTWSTPSSPARSRAPPRPHKKIGFRQIWTRNVVLTLVTQFLLAFHTSAFNSMAFVFLPAPRAPENSRQGFFHFGGGLGLPSSRVGLATAIIGFIGLPLQIFVYPRVQTKLGTLTSFRTFLPFSPIAYVLMPFLVILPRVPWIVWPSFTFVVTLQVISRTFILPASIILVNNCVTDSSILGTVHGVSQSVSSGARTLGPFLGGWGLGLGLENNMVGAVWWALAVESLLGWLMLWRISEGKGIEQKKDAPEDEE
ncbi:Major facilitator superfamily domain, general substrate transporter [Penicillium griseofulvum]|uniref:Major facilitator superfamily domain, general substrate transporter n=1 Tax=Penicillium patulum TaxID=5078 RepID=A0A135LDL8_PENPA|nr:Major facilitator superfamily domain, general substrate transporter [Penicillium griseofulvum]KXG47071.1 Major facilitator superfamily domain, general substrate transporter [Penicillium griseofulvum]